METLRIVPTLSEVSLCFLSEISLTFSALGGITTMSQMNSIEDSDTLYYD